MKILFIHCFYKYKGGEDIVYESEYSKVAAFAEVRSLSFRNAGNTLSVLTKLMLMPWNFMACRKLRNCIKTFKPEIIHLHNWHFAASPAVIRIARSEGIPIVCTLHNFRLLCPSAMLFHKGKVFMDSLNQKFPWTAIKKGVFRDSQLLTFWLSFTVRFHTWIGTWKMVSRYITLTPEAKDIFLQSQLRFNEKDISVKPNYAKDKGYNYLQRGTHFLYVGRLSEEKGIRVLLDAFAKTSEKVKIIGDGPLKDEIIHYSSFYPNILYSGVCTHDEVIKEMKVCNALLFTSTCYESMPLSVIEALSTGTPVIGSKLGATESMIVDKVNGLHFSAGSSSKLLSKILEWNSFTNETKQLYYVNSRESYLRNYTEESSISKLKNIYKEVIGC